jgi:hypothetical protein
MRSAEIRGMKNLLLIPRPLAFKSPQEGWRGSLGEINSGKD